MNGFIYTRIKIAETVKFLVHCTINTKTRTHENNVCLRFVFNNFFITIQRGNTANSFWSPLHKWASWMSSILSFEAGDRTSQQGKTIYRAGILESWKEKPNKRAQLLKLPSRYFACQTGQINVADEWEQFV